MQEIMSTLLVSCIPAIITGIVTYMTARKNARTQIISLEESNKHEIEKLMRQHEVDIESLKEKYQLEAERSEQEHRHKVEIMEIEHKNALESREKEQSNAAMFGAITDIIKDPSKLQGLIELANNPALRKN
ncbi:MAG: hypothetical protein NC321_13320 [Clostridium sp.]|nr:hypothetical protein [Clostridium sp.]